MMGTVATQITSPTIVYSIFILAYIKENIKHRATSLCVGNSPMTGEFSAQMTSNAEIFPINDVIMKRVQVLQTLLS